VSPGAAPIGPGTDQYGDTVEDSGVFDTLGETLSAARLNNEGGE
jgi:hypothetical protein